MIVVDNGSTDGTAEAVKRFQVRRTALNLRYVYEASPGLLAARHRGVAESEGELLSFIDDDVLVAQTWLPSIAAAFANPDVVLVGGPCVPSYEGDPPEWLAAFWTDVEGGRVCPWLSLTDLGSTPAFVDPNLIWGLNLSIRKDTLYEFGGFHPDLFPAHLERFTGDGETGLTMKLAVAGGRGYYDPGVRVVHRVPSSRLSLAYFEARARYGGIATSFTEARRGGTAPLSSSMGAVTQTVLHGLATFFRSNRFDQLRRKLKRAETGGWMAHQRWVRTDPRVRAWVRRHNYLGEVSPPGGGSGTSWIP